MKRTRLTVIVLILVMILAFAFIEFGSGTGTSPSYSTTSKSSTYLEIRGNCGRTTIPQDATGVSPINLTGVAGDAFCFALGIQGNNASSMIGPIYFVTPIDYQFNGGPNFTTSTSTGGMVNHTAPYPWKGFAKLTLLFWTYSVGTQQLKLIVRNGPTVTFVVSVASSASSGA